MQAVEWSGGQTRAWRSRQCRGWPIDGVDRLAGAAGDTGMMAEIANVPKKATPLIATNSDSPGVVAAHAIEADAQQQGANADTECEYVEGDSVEPAACGVAEVPADEICDEVDFGTQDRP